jgi:hypothetical protein
MRPAYDNHCVTFAERFLEQAALQDISISSLDGQNEQISPTEILQLLDFFPNEKGVSMEAQFINFHAEPLKFLANNSSTITEEIHRRGARDDVRDARAANGGGQNDFVRTGLQELFLGARLLASSDYPKVAVQIPSGQRDENIERILREDCRQHLRAFGSRSDQRFFLGGASFDKKVTRRFGHGQAVIGHVHHNKRKPVCGKIVRKNLSDPAETTNDRVLADAFDLTALFEFSKDFQNFSFCNETNNFADDENHGGGAANDD